MARGDDASAALGGQLGEAALGGDHRHEAADLAVELAEAGVGEVGVDGDQDVAVLEGEGHGPADVDEGPGHQRPWTRRARLEQARGHRGQAAGLAEVRVELGGGEQAELEQGGVEAAALSLLVTRRDLEVGGAEDGVGLEVAAQEAQVSLTT
nr:hypothetical protein [Nannocystis sp.]